MKICVICEIEKPLSEFYVQKRHSKKRGEYFYYHHECKECSKKKAIIWRKENPEKYKASKRKQNANPVTKKINLIVSRNRRKNGEFREWQRNNPEKIKEYSLKRSNKNHAISKQEWKVCKEYFEHSCAYCGISEIEHKELYNQQLHKEHVVHDGSNEIDNCIPSCKPCNSSKHTDTLEEWYKEDNLNFTQERLNKIHNWLNGDYIIYTKLK